MTEEISLNQRKDKTGTAREPERIPKVGLQMLVSLEMVDKQQVQSRAVAPGMDMGRALATARELVKARELGLPHQVFVSQGRKRQEHDADVIACLRAHHVDLVCLAGYMRLLSPEFVAAFPNRILNIHPSLLPAFLGLEAQEMAFDYGVKVAGCTVHFVDEHLDHGAIVVQRAIPVLETDDAHSLAGRILAEEHLAYTEAIARVASGEYEFRGRRFVKRK